MSHLHSRRARFAVRAIAGLILTLPLAGAECADLTSPGGSAGANYDGTYTLVTVDGSSLPANIIFVNSQNRLVLTKGEWTISGKSLTTRMWTTSYVNGSATSEARFNPEVHTCTVTIDDGTASCTLDSGSSISASIGDGTVVQSYSGHTPTVIHNTWVVSVAIERLRWRGRPAVLWITRPIVRCYRRISRGNC